MGVQGFLALEVLTFGLAASIHAGLLMSGYEHRQAAIAEAVIAVVLLTGLLVSMGAPRFSRGVALPAQGFALLGTCVGIVMIAIGVGPRTGLDFGLHAGMVCMLVAGLAVTARRPVGAFPG